jgi:hypothetical protein
MGKVVLKQTVHPNLKWMIGYPFLLAFSILTYEDPSLFYLILFPLLVIFYGFDYVFERGNKSYVNYNVFGFSVLRINKTFISPEYISLFKQAYIRERAFGFSPQILGDEKYALYTIKLFNNKQHQVVFESEDKREVLKLGTELSILLNVELYNTLE